MTSRLFLAVYVGLVVGLDKLTNQQQSLLAPCSLNRETDSHLA